MTAVVGRFGRSIADDLGVPTARWEGVASGSPAAPDLGPNTPGIGGTYRPNRPTTSVVFATNTCILVGCASDGWSCDGRRMSSIAGRRAPRPGTYRLCG